MKINIQSFFYDKNKRRQIWTSDGSMMFNILLTSPFTVSNIEYWSRLGAILTGLSIVVLTSWINTLVEPGKSVNISVYRRKTSMDALLLTLLEISVNVNVEIRLTHWRAKKNQFVAYHQWYLRWLLKRDLHLNYVLHFVLKDWRETFYMQSYSFMTISSATLLSFMQTTNGHIPCKSNLLLSVGSKKICSFFFQTAVFILLDIFFLESVKWFLKCLVW